MPFDGWEDVRRVLAIRLDNLGDVVMLGPALRSIRQALPAAHLTLMASPGGSLAAPMLPWIDEVFTWRASWQDISPARSDPAAAGREQELVRLLEGGHYQAALIFTSFSQSPYPAAYACYLAGIPIRVGQSREFGGALLTHWGKPPPETGHQVDRNLALLELVGIPPAGQHLELHLGAGDQARADQRLRQAGLDPLAPFAALVPGASAAARRYAPERYAQVARRLAETAGIPVVILGSEREREAIAAASLGAEAPGEPQRAGGRVISLVGQTDLPELAGILRRAGLVIANNSAALHLADAFQRPMVILYSGTEALTQWEPRRAPARLLRRETACSPCYQFRCPYQMECLDLPPEEVVGHALELMRTPYEVAGRVASSGGPVRPD